MPSVLPGSYKLVPFRAAVVDIFSGCPFSKMRVQPEKETKAVKKQSEEASPHPDSCTNRKTSAAEADC